MMKNLLKLSLGVIIFFTFFSCNKEKVSYIDEKSSLIGIEEIRDIAKKHNEAMDFVLEGLKKNNISFRRNKENVGDIINNQLEVFYSTRLENDIDIASAKEYSEVEVNRVVSLRYKNGHLRTDTSSLIQILIQNYSDKLSESQIQLLSDIEDVFSNSTGDFDEVVSKLDEIENLAISSLTEEEALPVIAGVEVGKESLQYWKENIGEWEQAISEGGTCQLRWFSWKEVAGSDVAGAVGGAVGAAVVNAIPGAGQVGYAGAVLGGAAGTSATDAVYQIWDHFF